MDATIHQLEHKVEDLTNKLEDVTSLLEESRSQGENTYKTLKETMAKKALLEGELKDLKEKHLL
jgi:flagellar biosynthesis chaperone FliJ